MSDAKFSTGYCIGTATNGNDWAWAKSVKKMTVGGKRVSMFYALEVVSTGSQMRQLVRETFLDKTEAMDYCRARCTSLY